MPPLQRAFPSARVTHRQRCYSVHTGKTLGTGGRSLIHALFGALYPVYVRGEAYLALHQGAEAATEFQKILAHRGIVDSDPIGALAHWQLGRAFALSGDNTKAKTAYEDFFALWKDADRDLPVLTQARSEYSKLQ